MKRAVLWLAGSLALMTACSGAVRPRVADFPTVERGITAVAYAATGDRLWFSRTEGDLCALFSVDLTTRTAQPSGKLPFCPEQMHAGEGGIVARRSTTSFLFSPSDGKITQQVVAERSPRNSVVRDGNRMSWIHGATNLPLPPATRDVRIADDDVVVALVGSDRGDELMRLTPDAKTLTITTQEAIDSFDVAPNGKELVFSARRNGHYDVALGSIDGGDIHWIPSDPADETMVSWAPRGNKVSYVIRSRSGDFVRTFHVPTSFQLTVPFPLATVHDLSWEPKAERYAVVVSSIDRAPHVDVLKYSGEEQKTIVPPAASIEASIDQVKGSSSTIFALPPRTIRYNEKYPVVVWVTGGRAFGWNAAAARLRDTAQIGTLFVEESELRAPGVLRSAIGSLSWVDASRMYVVSSADASAISPDATLISLEQESGTPAVVERGPKRVTIRAAERSVVESLAARYIAEHVKG